MGLRLTLLVLGLVLVANLGRVRAICYLEDAGSDCTVCWKTVYSSDEDKSGFTTMTQCPEGLEVQWLKQPPEKMFEGETYVTEYAVNIDLNKFPVVPKETKNSGHKEIPHANIHSCVQSRGACTPFVANSPGLATHTPALVEDVDDAGHSKFESDVFLTEESYMIIAHIRFYTPNTMDPVLPAVKYDLAIGVARTVEQAEVTVTSDSYVIAAAIGGIVLIIASTLVYVAWKGIVDVDKVMEIIFSDTTTLGMDILAGIADVLAFTLSIITSVQHDGKLIQILPLCCVFCAIAWLGSLWAAYEDLVQLYKIFLQTFRHDQHVKFMAARHATEAFDRQRSGSFPNKEQDASRAESSSSSKKRGFATLQRTMTSRNKIRKLSSEYEDMVGVEENLQLMHDYEMACRDYSRMRRTVICMVTENFPISVLSTYVVIVGGQSAITTIGLIFATLILGAKMTTLADYKQTRLRRDKAQADFDAVFNAGSLGGLHKIQIMAAETGSSSGSDTAAVVSARVNDPISVPTDGLLPGSAQPSKLPDSECEEHATCTAVEIGSVARSDVSSAYPVVSTASRKLNSQSPEAWK